MPASAAIYGCQGTELSAAERDFFRATRPFGVILFARNCVEPAQIRALCAALREAGGDPKAPILIDQEGGRVARLRAPFTEWPAMAALGRADDERLAALVGFPHSGGVEDGIHALLLRGVNERAGVDDDGVGSGGVVGDFRAGLEERAEHDFGVHEILGAAEGNHADADGRGHRLGIRVLHRMGERAARSARR